MRIIKVSAGISKRRGLLLRQSPESKGIWGDCRFEVNNEVEKCDWWFVLHGSGLVKTENCLCDPDHIIYVSMEPTEKMSQASDEFLKQFSCLVMCDRTVKHSRIIYNNWITWWVGIVVNKTKRGHKFSNNSKLNYEKLSSSRPLKKMNRISIIMSNKDFSTGHKKRIAFLDEIKNSSISKYIDIYGHGHNPIADKWDAIAPYKYHLVLENSIQTDYWSEKLADAFLGFSLPIYYGCPNVGDYFSRDSLCLIDIDNIDSAIETLQRIIEGNTYEGSIEAINISRDKVLNEYNIFNLMSEMAINSAEKYENIRLNTNAFFKDSFVKKIARFILSKFYDR